MATDSLQAVFFDFDGVICDSVNVKTDAFDALYADESDEIRAEVRRYHLHHGGISRYEKIRYYEELITGNAPDEDTVEAKASRFAELVVDKVVASAYIPGAEDALSHLFDACPLFVVSGTPENELRAIVEARGLSALFQGVFGAPTKKADILSGLIARHGFDAHRTAMIGDAMTDYDAAKATGIAFIGVIEDRPSPFPAGTHVINDLTGLLGALGLV